MWRNYLVTAVRHLTRNRLYAAISIASLTVGFAVAILVGIFLRHELTYDRFLPNYDRLYFARQTVLGPAQGAPRVSNETRIDIAGYLKADFPQIEAVTRLQPQDTAVQVAETIYPNVPGAWADPNLLEVLKLPLVAGDRRTALAAPDSVVITQSLARTYFGDADPIGQTLIVHSTRNGRISGALGPGRIQRVTAVLRDLPAETHIATQLLTTTDPAALDDPPAAFGLEALTYVRLARGASVEAVNRQLQAFVSRHIPPGPLMGSHFALQLEPLAELHLPSIKLEDPGDINPPGDRVTLAVAAGIAALILLTGSLNFVALMTSRASQRAVEIGVRKASGARRKDLAIQFLCEAMVQVVIAFVLALALGELLAPSLGGWLGRPLDLDYLADLGFLSLLAALAVGVGLTAGLYPSLVLSSLRPVGALKGATGASAWSAGVRQGLVITQFAVLVMLMIVIVTAWRQVRFSEAQALGRQGRQVLMLNGWPICGRAFQERVRAFPGVREVTCSADAVFQNNGSAGTATSLRGQDFSMELGPVEAGFFAFFDQRPLAGRTFASDRPADAPLIGNPEADNPPVVLNAAAARRFGFASPQAAVGRLVRWDRLSTPFVGGQYQPRTWPDRSEVLGVVPDYAGTSRTPVKPTIYWVTPGLMNTLSVRVEPGATGSVVKAMTRLWRASGHFTPPEIDFFDARIRAAYADILTLSAVITACSGIALVLAAVGLFAMAAFITEQRTKEMGVRKAMGASSRDIVRLLLWQFSKPVLAAVLIACPMGFLLMHWWLQGFAERVALTPASFLAVAVVAVLIAWGTVLAQTWRVARTRPVAALRYE